jgi:hypothetical protein
MPMENGRQTNKRLGSENQNKTIELVEISYFIILGSVVVVAAAAAVVVAVVDAVVGAVVAAVVIRHKHEVRKPPAYPTTHAQGRHNAVS